jgi:hypothetical protein
MDKQRTEPGAARRLIEFVPHFCGCDLCRFDLDDLPPVVLNQRPARAAYAVRLPPAASLAPRLPAGSPDSPAVRRAALARAHAEVFLALDCY